jgi:SAM-dependent methyltransferase
MSDALPLGPSHAFDAPHPTLLETADEGGAAALEAAPETTANDERKRKARGKDKPRKAMRGKDKPKSSDKDKPATKGKDKAKGKKSKGKAEPKGKAKARKGRKAPADAQSKHKLYQLSVQAPDVDAEFLYDYFAKITGRRGHMFREDFCGTAILCCHWVKLHESNQAIGVDIDAKTLKWGRKHNVGDERLLDDEQRSRVTLVESDVLDVVHPKVDLIAALNFSYSFFMTRDALRAYMVRCREALVDDGVLFFDAWGGSQTQEVMEEERKIVSDDVETFTYIWDQAQFDPITYHSQCRIHFRFRDGTEMRNAFRYRWRQWTLPELQELMQEAGFHDVHVLWEGTDKATNEGNGEYTRRQHGEADLGWIAYVVGHKNPPARRR